MLFWLLLFIGAIVGLAVLLGAGAYIAVRRSRPILNATLRVSGPSAEILIRRDAQGVPAITALNRADAAFGCGFLHAQERFFQMDVSRRIGAGELAELFGSKILPIDRMLRVHQFRKRARRALESLDQESLKLLRAYTAGVNSGLRSLAGKPFEYFLTFSKPRPWLEEDSLLTAYSLYILLQDGRGDQKYHLQTLYDALPKELADFLAVPGDEDWDAPLMGESIPCPKTPGPEIFSFRDLTPITREPRCEPVMKGMPNGSNCWVVSGERTAHGGAMLANDLHLGFSMPNTFFRASLQYGDANGTNRLTGFTLPGYPCMVTGSNEKVAWGFSNSAADWVDLIAVDADTETSTEVEEIHVKGGKTERLETQSTPFGPIIRTNAKGHKFAERWVAHCPGAVNLGLFDVEHARTVRDVLTAAAGCGIPGQNIHAADSAGDIGWTIAGRIPRRTRYSRLPTSPAEAGDWDGWLSAEEYPAIYNPVSGKLSTANARTVSGADLAKLGHGFYIHGARAHQIRDALDRMDKVSERDFLAMQLDDRAVFLGRWRDLLLSLLDDQRAELKRYVENWQGRAATDSVGYRAVRAFRYAVKDLVFSPAIEYVRKQDPDFDYDEIGDQWEAPLWRLACGGPAHLIPPGFFTWRECLLAAADAVIPYLTKGGKPMAESTWGESNRLKMRHAFSMVMPFLGRWLDMPPVPLNGDLNMPLSQIGMHGPVQRMIVAPGREKDGIGHLAGGQTPNPQSPYFGAGHDLWLRGEPAPFLPGEGRYELRLTPE
jgi:penicillin amidase